MIFLIIITFPDICEIHFLHFYYSNWFDSVDQILFSPKNASFLEDFTVFPLNLYSSSIFVRKVLFFYIFTINNFFSFKNFSSFLSKILITHFEWNEKYLTKFCYKVYICRSSQRKCSLKKLLLNISQYSQTDTCRSLFLINLQSWRLVTLLKRDSNTGVFLWILQNI